MSREPLARLGRVWNTFRRYKSLKYIVVVLLGVLLVGFLDENSVWNHFNNRRQIGELREEIARQRARYEADRRQIRLLDTDPKTIEINIEKVDEWIAKGAQPTNAVAHLIELVRNGQPAKEKKVKISKKAAAKAAAAAEAAAEAAADAE